MTKETYIIEQVLFNVGYAEDDPSYVVGVNPYWVDRNRCYLDDGRYYLNEDLYMVADKAKIRKIRRTDEIIEET